MKEEIGNAAWGDRFMTQGGVMVLYIGEFDGYPCFIPEGEVMPDRWRKDGRYPANEAYSIISKVN